MLLKCDFGHGFGKWISILSMIEPSCFRRGCNGGSLCRFAVHNMTQTFCNLLSLALFTWHSGAQSFTYFAVLNAAWLGYSCGEFFVVPNPSAGRFFRTLTSNLRREGLNCYELSCDWLILAEHWLSYQLCYFNGKSLDCFGLELRICWACGNTFCHTPLFNNVLL